MKKARDMHQRLQSNLDELSRVRHLVYGLHPIVSWLEETGHSYGEFLERAGIPGSALNDPDYKITPRQELDFYTTVCQALNIADLGLIIGPLYHLSSYGMLGLSAMTASNLCDCFQRFFDNIIMTWTYFRFSLYVENGKGVLEMEPLCDLGDAYQFMIDRDISASYTIACEALGRSLPLLHLDLKQAVSGYAEKYQAVFNAPIHFGGKRDALVFDGQWLDHPLEKSEVATSNVFAHQCKAISESLRKTFSLREHVRSLVFNWKEAPKSLEEVAQALHTTPRTLQRKLRAEGVGYKELVEDVRINVAMEYLQTTQLTIDAISARIGYADSSSFSHAFKRCSGKTPSAYRNAPERP
jgi:AraC-like DNA-binding protein